MSVIGLIAAALFFFIVLKWWSDGSMETSDAFILFVVVGGLLFGFFVSPTLWQRVLVGIPLVAAGVYAGYQYKLGSWKTLYQNRSKQYIADIEADPRNLTARERLADCYYHLGNLDMAVSELKAAVDLGSDYEITAKHAKWEKELRAKYSQNLVCRWCYTENALNTRTCVKCGSELPYDNAMFRWLTGGKNEKSRYILTAIAAVAIITISISILPPQYVFIPITLCALCVIGWVLISSSRS